MRLWFIVFALAAFPSWALSPADIPGMSSSSINVRAPASSNFRVGPTGQVFIGAGSIPGGAVANRNIGAYLGNSPLTMTLRRPAPPSALARAARVAFRAGAWGAAAWAAMEIYDLIYDDGQLYLPPSQDQYTRQGWYTFSGVSGTLNYVADNYCYNVIPQACTGWEVAQTSGTRVTTVRYLRPAAWGGPITYAVTYNYDYCPVGWTQSGGWCVPPLGPLADDAQVDTALEGWLVSNGSGPSMLQDLLDVGVMPEFGDVGVIGPATVPGETSTSTSTSPAGTTTTTTTTNYDLDYDGSTVTVKERTTTTVTDPSGNVTETETEVTPSPDGTPPEQPEQRQLCEDFPDISACQELGEPEQAEELQEEERFIAWDQEMSAAGSCPAPLGFNAMGRTFEFSYSPVCTFAEFMRPIFIALAWLSAGLWLFGIMRSK